jgi:hypothetical protein
VGVFALGVFLALDMKRVLMMGGVVLKRFIK